MSKLGISIVGMNNDTAYMVPPEFFQDRRIPAVEFNENARLSPEDEKERSRLLKSLEPLIKRNQAIDPTTPNKLPYGYAKIELTDYDPSVKKMFVKQYPLSQGHIPKFRKQIETWLTEGMIKKVNNIDQCQ